MAANLNPLNRQGTQGQLDGASKATLENEFGTSNDEEVIKIILQKGTQENSQVSYNQIRSLFGCRTEMTNMI